MMDEDSVEDQDEDERVRDFIARIHVYINLTSWDWPPVQGIGQS